MFNRVIGILIVPLGPVFAWACFTRVETDANGIVLNPQWIVFGVLGCVALIILGICMATTPLSEKYRRR